MSPKRALGDYRRSSQLLEHAPLTERVLVTPKRGRRSLQRSVKQLMGRRRFAPPR